MATKTVKPQIDILEEQPGSLEGTEAEGVAVVEDQEEVEEEEYNISNLPKDPVKALEIVAEWLNENYDGAPSFEQLMKWKQMHKNIFFMPAGDKVIVYRYLKRQEWMQIQTDERLQNMSQVESDEFIFDKCVLWPNYSLIDKAGNEAGLIPITVEQIQLHSLFLDAGTLARVTIKL